MNRGQPRRILTWNRLVFAVALSICLVRVESASGPIQVSENGRYFVDEQGKPFYFLADTQWELFRRYSLADTKLILENRKAKTWVTSRCRDVPNILWTLYPKANEGSRRLIARLAEGIQEGDPGKHVVSMHPDPSPASSSFMHEEPWLSFNSIQVWKDLRLIYPMTLRDYDKLPPKPATMLEGVYEKGEEYGYPITPLLVRREGYYTCMAGGFHGYGHNHSWRVRPAWREALDDPGARQMTVLKDVFTGLPEWWTLIPDQTVFRDNMGYIRGYADRLNLAAMTPRRDLSSTKHALASTIADRPELLVYAQSGGTFTVNLSGVDGVLAVEWMDPATGAKTSGGPVSGGATSTFTPPFNGDAVLYLRAC